MPKINTKRLKELRIEKGYLQKDLAKKLGYAGISGYNMIEKGNVDIPITTAKKIADIFECSIEDIFFTDEVQDIHTEGKDYK